MDKVELWGFLAPVQEADWDKVVPKELGKLVIQSAIKVEPPKLKQPISEEDNNLVEITSEQCPMDETVLYTIRLKQHAKQIQELISNLYYEEEAPEEKIDCPPMPEMIERKRNYSVTQDKEESDFASGVGVSVPNLSDAVRRAVLRKSVATVLAHAGFEASQRSALEILTDATSEYLKKITRLMRYSVDREYLFGNTGFPDAIERVYHEMGIGSIRDIATWYEDAVIGERNRALQKSEELASTYKDLCSGGESDLKRHWEELRGIKEEEVEDDFPVFHYPAQGNGDGVDELQPSLEPGFQMLHNLEQQAQLQIKTEPEDEDVNVSDSPPLPPASTSTSDLTLHSGADPYGGGTKTNKS